MYTVVGRITSGERIKGFRIVDQDTLEWLDISKEEAKARVKEFTNLKIHGGELKGKNGILSKYGIVGGSDKTYTILYVIERDGVKVGYEISDNEGVINRCSVDTVLKLYSSGKITNARMNNKGLSPIKGTFPIKEIIGKKVANI